MTQGNSFIDRYVVDGTLLLECHTYLLQIGDSWTAEDCSEYVCNAIGEVEQTAPTCGQQAECMEVDGELGCYCQPGFEGDPYDECTPITCTDEDGQEHQVRKLHPLSYHTKLFEIMNIIFFYITCTDEDGREHQVRKWQLHHIILTNMCF